MLQVTFPDGSVREFEQGITPGGIAAAISRGLAKRALAARVNGQIVDLSTPVTQDSSVQLLTWEDPEGRTVLRHTSSHILAQAVKRIFPKAKLAIGPAITDGFYYDFDLPVTLSTDDLAKIETAMEEIVRANLPLVRKELSREEAIAFFEARDELFKVELIQDLDPTAAISMYEQGDFVDLCAGPHLPLTGLVKAFKLTHVAGAYWRGDEKRPMLQRIYGTSFPEKKELEDHLARLEEAARRDHRKVGKELELFNIYDEAGGGLVLYHPKGSTLRSLIVNYEEQELLLRGYEQVTTPHIAKVDLWKTSGHYDFYRENMYFMNIDEQEYVLKPMNCPFHILIYKSTTRSYKDLPIRLAELGTVYRYERSGALHGLLRVRGFTQDDAHVFCRLDQLSTEIFAMVQFAFDMFHTFGFEDFRITLSTKPEKAVGAPELWEKAEGILKNVLEEHHLEYEVDEGGGAFYGPKIDIKIKDALGREWQATTVQCDFNLPERFEMAYIGADGDKHQPVMVHRAVLGSLERFIGLLTEQYAGAFPLWLAPVQAVLLPIADRHHDYAKELMKKLRSAGIRVELDERNEKIGYKIREAQMKKAPYMLVMGDKEIESDTISLRKRGEGDLGAVPSAEVIARIVKENNERTVS